MFAHDGDGSRRRLVYFGDSVYDNGYLLDDAEHVGDEHEMVFPNVEPAEVGQITL